MRGLRRVFAMAACCALVAGFVTVTTAAFWTGGGSGNALAFIGDLEAPDTPDISVANGTAGLSWRAADAGGSGPITYWVQRRLASDTTWSDGCATSATSGRLALTCSEIPGAGTYVWRVTALFATWTAVGDESGAVVVGSVDAVAPNVTLSAPATGAAVRTVINVAAVATDTASGVAAVTFQYSPDSTGLWFDIGSAVTVAPYAVAWDTSGVADYTYALRALAIDAAGNEATSVPFTVVVDNTDPGVGIAVNQIGGAISADGPGTTYFRSGAAGSISITATVSDMGSGAASATFSSPGQPDWSGGGPQIVTTPSGGPYVSTTYSWGTGAGSIPSLPVTVSDRAGNTSTTTIALVADGVAPTGSVTAPTSGANVRGTVTLASNAADAGSGVASAQFQVSPSGGGAWTDVGVAATSSPWTASWATPVTSADYDIRVVLTDRVGNVVTSSATTGVHVDNVAPAIDLTLSSGATGAVQIGTTVLFRSSVAGSLAIVATAGGTTPASSASFPAIATAGWTHPAETVSSPTGGPFVSSTFSWTPDASVPAPYVVGASDLADNVTTSSLTFTADNAGPATSVTAPAAGAFLRETATLTATSTDSGSGVASVRLERAPTGSPTWTPLGTATSSPYTVSFDTTTITDGLYDLRAVGTDALGNSTASSIVSGVRVDNIAPNASIVTPAASANVRGTVTVTSDSSDTGAGVASALFQRSPSGTGTWTSIATADTTAPYSASWATTGTSDGLYDVRVITTDRAGSTATSATVNVRVDNTLPTGSITSPAASAVVTGDVPVSANSADAGSGVASVLFQISPRSANTWTNIAPAVVAAPYQTSWSTSAYAEGLYDLRVITTDRAGGVRTSTTIGSVRVDRTQPIGAITAPVAGANVRSTAVAVTATATDTGGVAKVQFQYSPTGTTIWSNLNTADTTSPYSVSWNTTLIASGTYDIRAVITDKAGLVATTAIVTGIVVDNTVPTVVLSVTNPVNAARVNNTVYVRRSTGGSFGVVAAVTDSGSGPARATFPAVAATGWTHVAETVTTPTGGPYTSTTITAAVGTTVSPGTYTVTGADAAGNTRTAALTLSVDATSPTGAVTVPAAAANVRGAVIVTSSSADTGSGVATAQFQFSPAGLATWNNIGAAVTSSPYTTSWTTTSLVDGLYDLRVIATDRVGNTTISTTTANVRVDNTAPSATMTTPLTDAVLVGTTVALAGTATDAGSTVSNVQFQYTTRGGSTWTNIGTADTTSSYTGTWNTTLVTDGLYDLRALATDKAGNATGSTSIPVTVKNTAAVAAAATGPTQSIEATNRVVTPEPVVTASPVQPSETSTPQTTTTAPDTTTTTSADPPTTVETSSPANTTMPEPPTITTTTTLDAPARPETLSETTDQMVPTPPDKP